MFNDKLVCPICGTSHVKFQTSLFPFIPPLVVGHSEFPIARPFYYIQSNSYECPNCKSILLKEGFIYKVVKKRCLHCGNFMPGIANFCAECGAKLEYSKKGS